MVRKELVPVLVLLLFVAVAHAQDSKGPGPSSSEKEKRGFFKEKSRAAKREAGRERLQLTPEEREERRKASALYAALVEPRTPKEIAFPLSEEDAAKCSHHPGLILHLGFGQLCCLVNVKLNVCIRV